MQDLVIVSAGGFAREIAFLVDDINRSRATWDLLGYLDSDTANVGKSHGKYSIIGTDEFISTHEKQLHVVVGNGDPTAVWRIAETLSRFEHVRFPNLIHPSVIGDFERIEMGNGNIICAGNLFTTDIRIGSFNIFNLTCTVGHDTVIGNANVVNPGVNVSGGVIIEDRCLLGTGATILQNKRIGYEATVGAGAVVAKDVPPRATVVGVPAKPIDRG